MDGVLIAALTIAALAWCLTRANRPNAMRPGQVDRLTHIDTPKDDS